MIESGRLADKLMFVAIYLVAALLVVWGAGRIADYALDARFYRSYVMPWQTRLLTLRYLQVKWPPYVESDPMGYMQALTKTMQANGVQAPTSNMEHDYTYRLRRFGSANYQILVVYRNNRLVIYGLPEITFNRLDRFVDGVADPEKGDFTGRWSVDSITRVGYLKI